MAWGPAKAWHLLAMMLGMLAGRQTRKVRARHTHLQEMLQLIVLPFEDDSTLETERLERCPNAFVFYDPRTDRVETVPVCAWGHHKNAALRAVTDHYAGSTVEA